MGNNKDSKVVGTLSDYLRQDEEQQTSKYKHIRVIVNLVDHLIEDIQIQGYTHTRWSIALGMGSFFCEALAVPIDNTEDTTQLYSEDVYRYARDLWELDNQSWNVAYISLDYTDGTRWDILTEKGIRLPNPEDLSQRYSL